MERLTTVEDCSYFLKEEIANMLHKSQPVFQNHLGKWLHCDNFKRLNSSSLCLGLKEYSYQNLNCLAKPLPGKHFGGVSFLGVRDFDNLTFLKALFYCIFE